MFIRWKVLIPWQSQAFPIKKKKESFLHVDDLYLLQGSILNQQNTKFYNLHVFIYTIWKMKNDLRK